MFLFIVYLIRLLILAGIIYVILRIRANRMGAIHSNKSHYFDNLQFSAQEFYASLESIIKDRKIPGVKISRVTYHEKHILSNKREYLRIERKDDIFDICAAPFGTGFFVSYWHGEPKKRMRDMAMKVPLLSTAVGGWQGTTFYKIDTAAMFNLCVKDSITEAMDNITTSKGIRGFSEAERIAFNA